MCGDRLKIGGQAALAIGVDELFAGWNFCRWLTLRMSKAIGDLFLGLYRS